MEYLTRLIAFATERWPFHYHPLCKSLKLTHLMFADDLLMFCKGDAPSILLLMKAFTSFSNASGLRMNNTKSEIFFSGMVPELQSDILRVTGFREGTMPFGMHWGSNTARITLINSVLNTLHTYMGYYVLDSQSIKKVESWNWAAVGKLVNWVYSKADRLWIRWIGSVYLKTQDWHSYSPPADAPWTWKNICKTKEKLKEGFVGNYWVPDEKGYTLKNGYKWLCNQQPKRNITRLQYSVQRPEYVAKQIEDVAGKRGFDKSESVFVAQYQCLDKFALISFEIVF
ncbi:uncharacterized protein LOC141651773 [Silene latifolia]|uniref:uncharacterized protein LOC141651773 n=1 Tax=Silene latifolia TaxID=37657 RepID=UPI003D77F529